MLGFGRLYPFPFGSPADFPGKPTSIRWAPDASRQAHQAPMESRRNAVADAIVEADAWSDPRPRGGTRFRAENALKKQSC